ncbi:unnamed protein product [Withania somnifera]
MNPQSACSLLQHETSIPNFSQFHFPSISVVRKNHGRSYVRLDKRTLLAQNGLKFNPSLKRGLIVYASDSISPGMLNYDSRKSRDLNIVANNGSEPFRGKSGSVSFLGITHQMVEERKVGYITSAFFIMGFKIFAPLFALYVTWPSLGLPGLVAVAPFLVGCLVQYLFERFLDRIGSSSWWLVPIIFEIYRLYQLTRSVHFVEKLMFAMSGDPVTPELFDKNGAFVALIVTFQVLGITCLWSLLTFLQRLFPSRPVSENY